MPTTSRSTSTASHNGSHSDHPRTVSVLGLPPLPLPSTSTALYYGGIAALVAAELIEWPVALAVAVGHEVLTRRQKPK
jgi:hypothetical protein